VILVSDNDASCFTGTAASRKGMAEEMSLQTAAESYA